MSNHHYPPAYLRYLKARLLNLGRPSFWLTAICLSIFGLITWEYLLDPDVFTQNQNQQANSPKVVDSSLSTEDRAAIADIDNLPALTQDLEQANLPAVLSIPKENLNDKKNQSLFDDVISQKSSATNVTKSNPSLGIFNSTSTFQNNNPFLVQADNLLRSGYSHSSLFGAKSSPNSSEGIENATTPVNSNPANKAKNSVNISPLEAAINQAPKQNNPDFNSPVSSPKNIMGSSYDNGITSINQNSFNPINIMVTPSDNGIKIPSTNSVPTQNLAPNNNLNTGINYPQPTATNLTQNAYPNFNNSQPLPNGIAAKPVTQPVTSGVSNISPYSAPTSIPAVVNSSTPTVYGNYGVQQPTQLPQSRISLPRPTPGPYGGVQINGYTYP
ncbi:hypothetical protein H6G41_06130 [Tolypothrix sp. FACHB-123]|uniref:hypothetical protein n=1 Tax=Tolypothrix sp. FACHB-123 TaxID=2692868 RepID=UPI001682698D|nr:hypothetical protein [Tolypothrix sp. FACHB-123]MBD2354206.1 hypothetical protein [Tolypothrix sp. FACHB-123]